VSNQAKLEAHRRFWRGEGPSLILIPTAEMPLYDTEGYLDCFHNPRRMWEAEMRRARPVLDWPTDGIATVRPNLGVVFVPAIAGLGYALREGQMPWPGNPLSRESIRASAQADVSGAALMWLAAQFYEIHRQSGEGEVVVAYHPDTQGLFDIAHMLYGKDIFLAVADDPEWVHELMGISLDLYHRVSSHLKLLLGEPAGEMIHGHGTQQGVYFPRAGVRISEDAATLLSPGMIRTYLMPCLERAAASYGGCFVHYCGRHRAFFRELCRCPLVRAIDLGNSEMYDRRWLMEQCAETSTALYSRLAAVQGENWQDYARRLASLARETGARLILRPMVFPDNKAGCAAMRELWHELTC